MDSTKLQTMPAPPSLMKALTAGFDAISNHIALILFSITLDLVLWFGPRLRISQLFKAALGQPGSLPDPQSAELVKRVLEGLQNFNLMSVLRTFPVGIPSLMMARSPSQVPVGSPSAWEIPSMGLALGLWLVLTVVGLVGGTLYFNVVGQAALSGKVAWREALSRWPRDSLQILLLAGVWMGLILSLMVPFSCFLTMLLFTGFGLGQLMLVVVLVFGGILVWFLIPLAFSPHGIFVKQIAVLNAVKESTHLTRLTLPSTSFLLITLLVLSEGLDVLWNIPPEKSWLMLVGVAGHAFVTTSLLAASFIYYHDADLWVKKMLQEAKVSSKA